MTDLLKKSSYAGYRLNSVTNKYVRRKKYINATDVGIVLVSLAFGALMLIYGGY